MAKRKPDDLLEHRERRLALRKARREAGLNWYDVAKQLEWPLIKVFQSEQGGEPIPDEDYDDLMTLYGKREDV